MLDGRKNVLGVRFINSLLSFIRPPTPQTTDVLEQPIEFGARGPGPGNLVGINNGVLPAPLAAVALEFLLLAVGALASGADSYLDCSVYKTLLL